MYAIRSYYGMIRYNAKGEFNVPYGRYANLNTTLVTKAHNKLLTNTEIFNLDYSEIFKIRITSYNVCYTKLLRVVIVCLIF